MNINELDKFQLTKAINFNDQLNPQIFVDNKMRPEVRQKLMEIAEHFREFLGVQDLALVDITMSGSNAAYSYTPHSDIDLHVIVDFSHLPNDDVYRELFDAKKFQYNEQHDIKVKGYDVELYVQDATQPHSSLGEYSVMRDEWNRIPTKQRANLDDTATRLKYEKLRELAIMALASDNEQFLDSVLDIIKRYRKAGLYEKGEFGPENLAFKMIRTEGLFQKLWAKKREFTSRDLSLEAGRAHLDFDDEVLQGNLQVEMEGRQPVGRVLRRLYAARNEIFDDYGYDDLHTHANQLSMFEAEYEGNLGVMEVIQFYNTAPQKAIDLFKRLLSANKKKEAWQLIQKVTGTKLQGKEFNEDYESFRDADRDMVNPLRITDSGDIFELMDDVDAEIASKIPKKQKLSSDAFAKALRKMRGRVGKIENIPIKQIIGTEKYLVKDKIMSLLKGDSKSSSKLPILYKQNNKYYVGDGNHRIAAEFLSKKPTVRALVLDTQGILGEGVGKIVKGVNTTDDVGVNQTEIEAAKLGLKVTKDGVPPMLRTNGKAK